MSKHVYNVSGDVPLGGVSSVLAIGVVFKPI